MAIKETISADRFWTWLKESDNYRYNFSYEGHSALFEYLDNLSDELEQDIEFDPIAWCCEFSEFSSVLEAWRDYNDEPDAPEYDEMLEWLQDRTTVIEFDGGIIVGEF